MQKQRAVAERLIRPAGKSVYEQVVFAAMGSHGVGTGATIPNAILIDECMRLLTPFGSMPKPDSAEAIEQIKIAVKKYRSTLPPSAEGEMRLSLAQTYHQVAQVKGFKCWDAMVAVAVRQERGVSPDVSDQPSHDGDDFQEEKVFCCPECDSFEVEEIGYEDDFCSMRCKDCGYQGDPGEDFPSKLRFKPLSPIARKLFSFIKSRPEKPIHVSLADLAPVLNLGNQAMPHTEIRRLIRAATKELVDREILHIKSRVESHAISFYPFDRQGKAFSLPVFPQTDGTLVVGNSGDGKCLLPKVILKSTAEMVIAMSLEAKEEDRKNTAEYDLSKGRAADRMSFHNVEDLFAIYNMPTPKREALGAFLDTLTDEMLKDLVALAYSGRGDADYERMREHVRNWNHDGSVMKLIEIAQFLQKGLEQL
jgi:hypothetical protein